MGNPRNERQKTRPKGTISETKAWLEAFDGANGGRAFLSKEEWEKARETVIAACGQRTWMRPGGLRPFVTATCRLAQWAQAEGLETSVQTLLQRDVIEAFLAATEHQDARPFLAKLAFELNGAKVAGAGKARPKYQVPYSEAEIEALIRFAKAQSSEFRRDTLLAYIGLGAGAGIVRGEIRSVRAMDLHQHGEAWFVRVSKRCARVDERYRGLIEEAAKARPKGTLIVNQKGKNHLTRVREWAQRQQGVPRLCGWQLRATYIKGLVESPASLMEPLSFTGIEKLEALTYYVEFASPVAPCEGK